MSPTPARLSIVFAALLWSTGGAAVKVSQLNAMQIAGGRALLAGVAMFALLPVARRGYSLPVLRTGAIHAVNCVLFVYANQQTTAGNVIFIQNIAPVWVLLLSVRLTGERPSRPEMLSVLLSLVGCAFLFLDNPTPGRSRGNVAALAASVGFGLLILSYRRLSKDEGLAAVTSGNFMIAAFCLPWALQGPRPTAADWGALLHLGLLQQALGHFLFIRGMSGVTALEGSLLTLLEAVASPFWAWWLVDERPGLLFAVGASIVLGAQVWRLVRKPKPTPDGAPAPPTGTDGRVQGR